MCDYLLSWREGGGTEGGSRGETAAKRKMSTLEDELKVAFLLLSLGLLCCFRIRSIFLGSNLSSLSSSKRLERAYNIISEPICSKVLFKS